MPYPAAFLVFCFFLGLSSFFGGSSTGTGFGSAFRAFRVAAKSLFR
jgi:hypothetical protein